VQPTVQGTGCGTYLATYDELNALSDRELADIGLSRPNVRDVARQAACGN